MKTIDLRTEYQDNLEIIQKLKDMLKTVDEKHKNLVIESINKVKDDNDKLVKKMRKEKYHSLSKKDFSTLMKNDRKYELDHSDFGKEIVVEKSEIGKVITNIETIEEPKEEIKTVIITKTPEKKDDDKTDILKSTAKPDMFKADGITEVLSTKISSDELKSAKIVFDGEYKLIYNNGKNIYAKYINEKLLENNYYDKQTVFDFNIIKLLKDFDKEFETNLYFKYMENRIPVEYDFDKVKITKDNSKNIKRAKEIAKREIDTFDNVTMIDNSRKIKFKRGLISAAAGVALLGGLFGLKKINFSKDIDLNAKNTETVAEVTTEATTEAVAELATEATTERVTEVTTEATTEAIMTEKEDTTKKDVEKAETEVKEDNLINNEETIEYIKLGDTVEFDNSISFYTASTDTNPSGNSNTIKGNYSYKAKTVSVVNNQEVMELIYSDSMNINELERISKEKYGEDTQIFINFDLVDEYGNVVTMKVAWVKGEDVKTLTLK